MVLQEALRARELRDLEEEVVKKALYSSAAKQKTHAVQAQLAANVAELQVCQPADSFAQIYSSNVQSNQV